MSLAAITVVVVLASSEPDGAAPAMEQALHVALGDDARVVIEHDEHAPESDERLLAHAEAEHASVVGFITWRDHQRRASMRFARAGDGKWAEREIRFDASDAPAERGRTVGFAIASLFPEEVMAARKRAAAAASATSPAAQTTPSAPPPPAPPPPTEPAPSAPRSREEARPEPFAARDRTSVEAVGAGVAAIDGYGGGVGGAIGLRIPIGAGLRLRAAIGLRGGEIAEAQASSRVVDGTVGLAWQAWLDVSRRWFAGARAEALVQRHELVHLSSDDDTPDHRVRWLPGGVAAGEVGWRFTEQAAIFGATGLEAVLGRSAVVVHGREVASISPVRVLGEAGLRVSF
jgi:hypothetical protein